MEFLKAKIRTEGHVIGNHILKVDAFLNHQLDIGLLNEMGKVFFERFKNEGITKILTIEASGIAIASIAAQYFNVPVVFAKKAQSLNLDGDMLTTKVHSYTKNKTYDIMVAKRFIDKSDVMLIMDDFLAEGSACRGLIEITEMAGAKLGGIGIAIEKGFQDGGKELRARNLPLYSLAVVEKMSDTDGVTFKQD
ncbi:MULTISPECIES: xanthine phosphoribosyltransferase [unclassified Fusibacter]|uniref:xanthine phosphoribosyltransferase n=1 Tax=unclassified Fusibacter TaxID=2624464 RepID=UPI00101014EA|nr:xanthine phosphoribosyltransferase [Fusibacter sp. A1]MCK8059954.1 xanthine phosphoribosyltransferase [Fusibacter sp. A2]NPE22096.1 xanthine phosphoribosyltransferase [Fusibacter sp. A1]RXV60875.1 xanthine phosphoribosyltransferase [Fusibacter sp. A1]